MTRSTGSLLPSTTAPLISVVDVGQRNCYIAHKYIVGAQVGVIWAELFRWFKTSSSSWATGQHPTGTPNPSYCIQPVHSPIGCVFGVPTKSTTSRKQQLSQVPSSPHHLQQTPPPSISLPNRWFSCCSSAQQCWLRNSSCAQCPTLRGL